MGTLLPPGLSLSTIAATTDDLQLKEWCESLLAVIQSEGVNSAKEIMDALAKIMQHPHIGWKSKLNTPYINTIDVTNQPAYPGDLATEERLASIMRWNALTMVVRANKAYGDPRSNLAVTADLLREHYADVGDWVIAAGRYHRPAGGAPAARYRMQFSKRWQHLEAATSNRRGPRS